MIDEGDAALVRAAFRALFASSDPVDVRARLVDEGWHELADGDEQQAVGVLFEEQGRSLAASGALDLVVARAAGCELQAADAIVHPGGGPPNERSPHFDGVLLTGPEPRRLLVPTGSGAVAFPAGSAELAPIAGFDPTLGLRSVRLHGMPLGDTWHHVTPAVRRALAHELIGITEAILELAVRQISDRQQYGRPIGSFQAVQHRMADVAVALDAARAVTAAAWRTPGSADPLACQAAKALAGRAALLAARHCQQVSGAIGFTVEHPLPRYVRRAHVLDTLYGSAASLQSAIGHQLLVAGKASRLPAAWDSTEAAPP